MPALCRRGQHNHQPGDFDYFELLPLQSFARNVDARSTRECTESNPPYGLVLHGDESNQNSIQSCCLQKQRLYPDLLIYIILLETKMSMEGS
jgi:hypothetical protein